MLPKKHEEFGPLYHKLSVQTIGQCGSDIVTRVLTGAPLWEACLNSVYNLSYKKICYADIHHNSMTYKIPTL